MRNTLETENLITPRRTGKTIRQIDKAIQILFEDNQVKILSHEEDGNLQIHNLMLFKRVKKRLLNEHCAYYTLGKDHAKNSLAEKFTFDEDNLTIKLNYKRDYSIIRHWCYTEEEMYGYLNKYNANLTEKKTVKGAGGKDVIHFLGKIKS